MRNKIMVIFFFLICIDLSVRMQINFFKIVGFGVIFLLFIFVLMVLFGFIIDKTINKEIVGDPEDIIDVIRDNRKNNKSTNTLIKGDSK